MIKASWPWVADGLAGNVLNKSFKKFNWRMVSVATTEKKENVI